MSPAMEPTDTTKGYNPSMMAAQGPWTGVPGAFGIPGYATYGAAPGFPTAAPSAATQMPTPAAPMGTGMAPCPMGGPMAGPMAGPMGWPMAPVQVPGFNFKVSQPCMQGNPWWPGMQANLFWPGMQANLCWPGMPAFPGWPWPYGMGPGMTGGPAGDPMGIDP